MITQLTKLSSFVRLYSRSSSSVSSPSRAAEDSWFLSIIRPQGRLGTLLRVAEFVIIFGLIAFGFLEIGRGGFFARDIIGIHWFYILIFLGMFAASMLMDKISGLYIFPIALVYYCLHEGIFNSFFIPYHNFQLPPNASLLWYGEIGMIAIVAPVFLIISVKYRKILFRDQKWRNISIALWASFLGLYLVRIAMGFPVTLDVYSPQTYAITNTSWLANGFEFTTNSLFAVSFYCTFSFRDLEKLMDPRLLQRLGIHFETKTTTTKTTETSHLTSR